MVGLHFDFLIRSTRFLRRHQSLVDVFSRSCSTKTRSDGRAILAQHEGGSSLPATQMSPSALRQPCTHILSDPKRPPIFQLRFSGADATLEHRTCFPAEFRRGKRLRAGVTDAQAPLLERKQSSLASATVRSSWAGSSAVRRHLLSATVCGESVSARQPQYGAAIAFPSSSSSSSIYRDPRRRPGAAWSVFPGTAQPNTAIPARRAGICKPRKRIPISAPCQPASLHVGTIFPGTCTATLSPVRRRISPTAAQRTVCSNALASDHHSLGTLATARIFLPTLACGPPTFLSADSHVVHDARYGVRFPAAAFTGCLPVTGGAATAAARVKQSLTIRRMDDGASTAVEDTRHKGGIPVVEVVRQGKAEGAKDRPQRTTKNGRFDDTPVPVLIDVHEKRLLELAAKAEKMDGVKFIRTALKTADVVIGHPPHEILIERKTTQDLFSSLEDTRLHNQLNTMFSHTRYQRHRSVLAIEGSFADMVSLMVRDDVSVLRTWNTEETFRVPNHTLFRFVLETAPGISSSIARLLLRDVKPTSFSDVIDRLGRADGIEFLTASCGATSPAAQRLVKLLCRPDCDALTRQQFIDRLTTVRGVSLAKSRKIAEESLETLKLRRFEGFNLTTSVRLHLCAIFGVKYTDFPARLQELGLSPHAIAQAAELCKLLVPDALALRRWEHYERMVSKVRRKDLTKKVAKEICRAFPDALPPKTQLHKFLKGKLAPAIVARLYEND
eukprot:GEMP01016385.1.p1 GENE.GEMP01016385.1~~GEMP01016385.1.p1  ORF type:complete len:727 (+),score=103.52 GEMP01016385.1:134-2314(+)